MNGREVEVDGWEVEVDGWEVEVDRWGGSGVKHLALWALIMPYFSKVVKDDA